MIDRFGPVPSSLINLFNEFRLRLKAAQSGISSLVRRDCGIVCSLPRIKNISFSVSKMNYVETFFSEVKIDFHFLPDNATNFSFCFHLSNYKDIYSFISLFLDKFNAPE